MEKKVIDDRDALQPNNAITYEEETLVYSDKKIELIHNFYSNSARDLAILTYPQHERHISYLVLLWKQFRPNFEQQYITPTFGRSPFLQQYCRPIHDHP
jgi:hypothetical protein